MINKLHQEIISNFEKAERVRTGYIDLQKYLGTPREIFNIRSSDKLQIARHFKKNHPEISFDQFIDLLNSLAKGKSFDERAFLSTIIHLYPPHAQLIQPTHIDTWLSTLEGWCEIDSLCQSTFSSDFFLKDWDLWNSFFQTMHRSPNISKRRASLVLLTKPVRQSTDPRLSDAAFSHVDAVRHEKDILITKAVSWILRSLIKNHRHEVETYLQQNEKTLPKIALRETKKKLLTGKKI